MLCRARVAKERSVLRPGAIRRFFGASSATFFSLCSSIWPQTTRPAAEASNALVGLKVVDSGDIDEACQFVDRDCWDGFDDQV